MLYCTALADSQCLMYRSSGTSAAAGSPVAEGDSPAEGSLVAGVDNPGVGRGTLLHLGSPVLAAVGSLQAGAAQDTEQGIGVWNV